MGYIPPLPPRIPCSERNPIPQADPVFVGVKPPSGFVEAMLGASILAGLIVSVAYVVLRELAAFTTGGAF